MSDDARTTSSDDPSQASTSAGEIPVHPLAAAFPMMPEDELAELAADILHNGQRETIKRDPTGLLLDGRNRLEACRRAGVQPRFEIYTGDPIALIVSANLTRRHLNAGQRAMGYAMAYPDTLRGKASSVKITEVSSASYISHARTVLRHSQALARRVMAGDVPLDRAYAAAMAARVTKPTPEDEPRAHRGARAERPAAEPQPESFHHRATEANAAHAEPVVSLSVSAAKVRQQLTQDQMSAEAASAKAKSNGTHAEGVVLRAAAMLSDPNNDLASLAALPDEDRATARARLDHIVAKATDARLNVLPDGVTPAPPAANRYNRGMATVRAVEHMASEARTLDAGAAMELGEAYLQALDRHARLIISAVSLFVRHEGTQH